MGWVDNQRCVGGTPVATKSCEDLGSETLDAGRTPGSCLLSRANMLPAQRLAPDG